MAQAQMAGNKAYKTQWQLDEYLRVQLELERSSFIPHWRDLGDHYLPRRVKLDTSDVNRGERRNLKIIDSTGTKSARTLRSGMMSGVTSPARPWFKVGTADKQLSKIHGVNEWLDEVRERMVSVFLSSNLYNALPIVYGDLGVFATAAMMVEEDFEDVIRCYVFPVGSYTIANDERGKVAVFQRRFKMTVRQLVAKFADKADDGTILNWETNFSETVRNLWDQGDTEQWIEVNHIIKPNEKYDPRKSLSKFKKFRSCYYEMGASGKSQSGYSVDSRYLSERGYDYFPVLVPRWQTSGEDVYGTDSPGMDSLGDVRALQHGERKAAKGLDKMIDPAMVGPTALKTAAPTLIPGTVTFVDEREGQKGFRAAHEVSLRLDHLESKQEQVRNRIKESFYVDMFKSISELERQATATEINERRDEKLTELGPVLEQLNQDLLDPLIDITYMMMDRQGLIPSAPQELQNQKLKIEYVSMLHQAQKLVGISGVERYAQFTITVGAVQPEIFDKTNIDELANVYADMASVPPKVIRTDEEAAQIRSARAEAAAAQAKAEMISQGARAAKDLSGANLDGNNALSAIAQGGAA